MVDAPRRRVAGSDCRLHRRHSNARVHRTANRVADHLARPGIKDCGQVDEATGDGDVGQMGDPQLVGAIGNDRLGQVWENRARMIAVGRDDIAPTPLGLCELLPVWWIPPLARGGDPLEFHRADVADGRVAPLRIVEELDVVKHVRTGLIARAVDFSSCALGL